MTFEAIEFRQMSQEEYFKYSVPQLESYAQDIARNFKRPIDEVRIEAKEQVNRVLKEGLSTQGHFLFNVIERKTGETVGHIWYNVERDKRHAFLYDILIHKLYRGKGYGRKTLQLLEAKLRDMGITQLGLHVFADNQGAINLYKKQDYYTASFNMQKDL